MGGSVSAEFAANRPGLEISCHLTHLDEFGFKQDCKLEDTHMTCGSVIDRMVMDAWLQLQVECSCDHYCESTNTYASIIHSHSL